MTTTVAAGVPPAVEGGVSPPGKSPAISSSLAFGASRPEAAGQDARLYCRPEARRYGGRRAALSAGFESVLAKLSWPLYNRFSSVDKSTGWPSLRSMNWTSSPVTEKQTAISLEMASMKGLTYGKERNRLKKGNVSFHRCGRCERFVGR